jgi:hypothetical protein
MKYHFLIYCAISFHTCLFGQTPQAFSFQGVAFNNQGQLVKDKDISVEVKIIQGSVQGLEQYKEIHHTQTNEYGLYSLSIGRGTSAVGEFHKIEWSNTPMYISISLDIENGSNYVLAGVTELLSVPYALQAGSSKIRPKIYVRKNPTKRIPILLTNGINQGSNPGYHYEWIHGEPEDVYVDYIGLPANVALSNNYLDGYGIDPPKINYSLVDTIIGGILETNVQFIIANSSMPIVPGEYTYKMIFRTKNEVLDSLEETIKVLGKAYEDCAPSVPYSPNLKSTTCDSLANYILSHIQLDELSGNELSITNPLNNTEQFIVNFIGQPCLFSTLPSSYVKILPNGENVLVRISALSKTEIEFNVTSISSGQTCLIKY